MVRSAMSAAPVPRERRPRIAAGTPDRRLRSAPGRCCRTRCGGAAMAPRRPHRQRAAASPASSARRGARRRSRCAPRRVRTSGCSSSCDQERDVGADAEDRETRAAPRWRAAIAASRVSAVRDQLGEHRVVVHADARRPRRTPVSTRMPGARRLAVEQERAGLRQEVRPPDPPRRRGTRSRGRAASSASCVQGSGSPAATASCARTRSTPVTASVTGCSTCSRVFISRK